MVTATNKILLRGGVILLLPLIAYSYNRAGLQVGYSVTDNIYQLDIKDAGQIMGVNPYFSSSGLLDFDYVGEISLINFDAANLLVANDIAITKNILLPGVGNKTAFYADIYGFYTPSHEQYRIAEMVLGNSLNVYFGNYLFFPETKLRYRHYFSDSISSYLEPSVQIGLRIPLPYFSLIPKLGAGFRHYLEEFVPLYTAASHLYFPLTLDFSIAFSLYFLHASYPQSDYITSLRYVDDPFFEEENINKISELSISINRILAKQRVFVEARFDILHKEFYEIENLDRSDKRLQFSLQFTKFINDNLGLHINGYSLINTSTLEDFDYIKNAVELNLELIF